MQFALYPVEVCRSAYRCTTQAYLEWSRSSHGRWLHDFPSEPFCQALQAPANIGSKTATGTPSSPALNPHPRPSPREPVEDHTMPRKPSPLLLRLFTDSLLPCAAAALALAAMVTIYQLRSSDAAAHTRIAAQLEHLAGKLEHQSEHPLQTLLDEAMREGRGDGLQRIEVIEADGRQLSRGFPAHDSLQRYRRDLADSGQHRAVIMHYDPLPQQQARQHILLFGALTLLGIFALIVLGTVTLRHHTIQPLQRLQNRLNALLESGGVESTPRKAERHREFAHLQASIDALEQKQTAQRAERASMQQASAEDALDQLRQNLAATRSKSKFMALVGHHFRQPMQALQLLTAGLYPGIDDDQQQILGQVRGSISAMTRLLDALLEISQLEAGVVLPTKGTFNASDLFLHDRASLMNAARNRQVTLVWRQCWEQLQGDMDQAAELLHQLASNAIQHSPPHGRVLISARRRGSRMRIEVRDNGPGIAAIHQERIFEEFVQLSSEAERGKGYGLGLPIAARRARVIGTEVGLRSEPGRGSTFWFELERAVDSAGRAKNTLKTHTFTQHAS